MDDKDLRIIDFRKPVQAIGKICVLIGIITFFIGAFLSIYPKSGILRLIGITGYAVGEGVRGAGKELTPELQKKLDMEKPKKGFNLNNE